ncbi:MAG: hypothetical protein J2P41_09160 [Blastocatellia bacterium]|nr:hypothetical protein [Blastocatellia bacterium]
MKKDRRQFIASSLLSAGALSLPARPVSVYASPADEPKTTSLRGRIVCLTEELQKPYRVIPDCDHRGHLYTLKSVDGTYYPLLPVDTAAAVWMDERYRQRELQLSGRVFKEGSFFEVFRFQSWREGKLYDLYYFCDVCMISAHKPGPCECCHAPVEFRETLSEDQSQP